MDDGDLREFIKYDIAEDYRAILKYCFFYLNNHCDYTIMAGLLPYISMFVLEGHSYLSKRKIIEIDSIDRELRKEVGGYRAKGVKLYGQFNMKEFNNINNFIDSEYNKFLKSKYKKGSQTSSVETYNYFLALLDNEVIGNYHWYTKKIFDIDISICGDKEEANNKIAHYVESITKFIAQVYVCLTGTTISPQDSTAGLTFKVEYLDLNMKVHDVNFNESCPRNILLALLDVLCSLNYYRKIFYKINSDFHFDIKIKYCTLFYATISIKKILEFCKLRSIEIGEIDRLENYILELDSMVIKNNLRKVCMHYEVFDKNYHECQIDPFIEEFEKELKQSIENIQKNLHCYIENLSNIVSSLIRS